MGDMLVSASGKGVPLVLDSGVEFAEKEGCGSLLFLWQLVGENRGTAQAATPSLEPHRCQQEALLPRWPNSKMRATG